MVSGEFEVGPNAVLAFKRECYINSDINLKDTFENFTYVGFLNFLRKNFNFAMVEFASSLSRASFIAKTKVMIPEVKASILVKRSAGLLAQAKDSCGKLSWILTWNSKEIRFTYSMLHNLGQLHQW
jgi:L-2-hydroxyglutarate oxidase